MQRVVLCSTGEPKSDSAALYAAATVDMGRSRSDANNLAFQTTVALALARVEGVLPLAVVDTDTGYAVAVVVLVEFGWAHAVACMSVDERHPRWANAVTKLVEWVGALSPVVLVPPYHDTCITAAAMRVFSMSSAFVVCRAAPNARLTDTEPELLAPVYPGRLPASSPPSRGPGEGGVAAAASGALVEPDVVPRNDVWAVCVWASTWTESIACLCLRCNNSPRPVDSYPLVPKHMTSAAAAAAGAAAARTVESERSGAKASTGRASSSARNPSPRSLKSKSVSAESWRDEDAAAIAEASARLESGVGDYDDDDDDEDDDEMFDKGLEPVPVIVTHLYESVREFVAGGSSEACRVFGVAAAATTTAAAAPRSSATAAAQTDARPLSPESAESSSAPPRFAVHGPIDAPAMFDGCRKYSPCSSIAEIVSPRCSSISKAPRSTADGEPDRSKAAATAATARYCSTCPEFHIFACAPSSAAVQARELVPDVASFLPGSASMRSAQLLQQQQQPPHFLPSERETMIGVFTTCAREVARMICTGRDDQEFGSCEIEALCDCGHAATDGAGPAPGAFIWDALSVVLALGATCDVARNVARAKPLSLRLAHVSMLAGRREHAVAALEGAIVGLDRATCASINKGFAASWDAFDRRQEALPLGPIAFAMRALQLLRSPESRARLAWGTGRSGDGDVQYVADRALLLFAKALEYADSPCAAASMRPAFRDLERASLAAIEAYARAVSAARASIWGFIPLFSSPSSSFRRSKWLDWEINKLHRSCMGAAAASGGTTTTTTTAAATPSPIALSPVIASRQCAAAAVAIEPAVPRQAVVHMSSLATFVSKYFDKMREEQVFAT
jgi:hypothetical protein